MPGDEPYGIVYHCHPYIESTLQTSLMRRLQVQTIFYVLIKIVSRDVEGYLGDGFPEYLLVRLLGDLLLVVGRLQDQLHLLHDPLLPLHLRQEL